MATKSATAGNEMIVVRSRDGHRTYRITQASMLKAEDRANRYLMAVECQWKNFEKSRDCGPQTEEQKAAEEKFYTHFEKLKRRLKLPEEVWFPFEEGYT